MSAYHKLRATSDELKNRRGFVGLLGVGPFVLLAGLLLMPAHAATAAPSASSGDDSNVPVEKVVLFSSGVGYFEHGGTVSGDGVTELHFKSAQINDILKSLVLEDLDGGQIGTVVYPSQDPLNKTLRSFQVDISQNPPLSNLLNQLRGAEVTVVFATEQVKGTILGVESRTEVVGVNQTEVKVWLLNMVDGGTIRTFRLDDIRKLELDDQKLQEELSKALAALAQARDQDKKPVEIRFRGKGDRRVRVGYVVETPVWKTSYRLVMPGGGEAKGYLQGWAIVENQTDNDWNGVELSLVSGRPISFIQDMYTPLYVPRPVVRPELYASLTPQTYSAGMDESEKGVRDASRGGGLGGGGLGGIGGSMGKSPFALQQKSLRGQRRLAGEEADMAYSAEGAPSPAEPISPAASVASAANAEEIGELFQYTVPDVSLPRQRSAMIPIVTDNVEVERVSIYNQNVLASNPLNGALLKNTSGKHLLQGPITVFDDGGYAGDARIDNVPPDQKRLLSYAIDLKVKVSAENRRSDNQLQTAKIVKGALQLIQKWTTSQEYLIENTADKARTIIVEHPKRGGWDLVDTPKPDETTDTLYRFRDTVAAGEKKKLTVSEENVRTASTAILSADIGYLTTYSTTGNVPQKVRDVLARAIEMKTALVDTERTISQHQSKIASITQEQDRIRRNMQTVDRNSEYYNRLLSKLNDQETEIEQLQSALADLEKTRDRQRNELENYLLNMTVP